MNGLQFFAKYALPPNLLGYCGPAFLTYDRSSLLQFEGAVPYLCLIARANNIKDEFDKRVVEAYWLGNDLLRNVSDKNLYSNIEERFRKRMNDKDWFWLVSQSIPDAKPHHAFHVFDIYRRAGLLRSGIKDKILETMDNCRINWGRVAGVEGNMILVECSALQFKDKQLRFGVPTIKKFSPSDVPIATGDEVSIHWNCICDKISPRQKRNLIYWTNFHLDLANKTL